MKRVAIGLLCAGLTAGLASKTTEAQGERTFRRVGTFSNYRNAGLGSLTVSEIVAATPDGLTLVYTDGPGGAVGFIDITDPAHPKPAGTVLLDHDPDDAIGAEPTSVDVVDHRYLVAAVNTSASDTNPSGFLAVVDLHSRTVVREIDLGGQPDSVRVSPNAKYIAVAIENERSETLCVGGTDTGREVVDDDDYVPGVNTTEDRCEDNDGVVGGLPQTPFGNPPGYLAIIETKGPNPSTWFRTDVALTGLAEYAPEDPEPEFVDINQRNEAVVTLQENNHIVVVKLKDKTILSHFAAGRVDLTGVDTTEDRVISLTESLAGAAREPDGVVWVPGPGPRIDLATANEGDLFGGSRGFSIFSKTGALTFDSGASLESTAVRYGHYPESRSENKGAEPEAIEAARFGPDDYLFVGSERGSFVAVYKLDRQGQPSFVQLLPAPLAPEGLLAIPQRNLLVASGEEDDPRFGVRSTVMIYELTSGLPAYPQILSANDNAGSPIPWSALSGMTSVPGEEGRLLAVWDSYYAESRILQIDATVTPAVITGALTITGGRGNYDPEGIAIAPDQTIWVASEGNANDSRPNLLIQVDAAGQVLDEVGLPQEIIACRAASSRRGTLGSGFEGVAVLRRPGDAYRLIVAQQRGWDYTTPECEDLDDDSGGLNAAGEPNKTRLWTFDPVTRQWDHISWRLADKPADASWVGLSEISETPSGGYILIERDNRTGDFGLLKTLVQVSLGALADKAVSTGEKSIYDLRPSLLATNGWITDKPEGVAVTPGGRLFVVTDNDGVEDWSGETWFLDLGAFWTRFP